MRHWFAFIALGCLCGCNDYEDAFVPERKPINPPGIAGIDDIEAVEGNDRVVGGGQQQQAPAERPRDGKGIIGKTTYEVVNYKEYKGKDGIIVTENKITAQDPLMAPLQAYVSARSRVTMLNFQHQVNIMKQIENEGKNLTFEQFMKVKQDLRIELTALYPWQKYAYDEDVGGLLIIEDRNEKRRRFKKAGLEFDEETD